PSLTSSLFPYTTLFRSHKARLALERMCQHQELTSLPFDPVMVFPHGVYSTGALKALKQTGYQAVVNTDATAHPVDCAQHPLALRDRKSTRLNSSHLVIS